MTEIASCAPRQGWLDTVPGFPDRLRENPPRQGFFEHPEYLAVRAHLPAPWRWCADAGRPTRFKPSRPSPTDAVRDGSAKLGHPVQNVTREHGLTPLPR